MQRRPGGVRHQLGPRLRAPHARRRRSPGRGARRARSPRRRRSPATPVYVTSMDGTPDGLRRSARGRPSGPSRPGAARSRARRWSSTALVYVGTWAGVLYAVDAETGEQRWRFQAPADIKGSAALADGADRRGRLRRQRPRPRPAHGRRALDLHRRHPLLRRARGERRHDRDRRRRRRRDRPRRPHRRRALAPLDRRVLRLLDARRSPTAPSTSARTTAPSRRSSSAAGRCAGPSTSAAASRARRRSSTASSTPPASTRPGSRRAPTASTPGTGAVRYQADDGRYSPAVGAGRTLYLVGHAARLCPPCALAVSASG